MKSIVARLNMGTHISRVRGRVHVLVRYGLGERKGLALCWTCRMTNDDESLDCHLWHFEAGGRRFAMRVPWARCSGRAALSTLIEMRVRRFGYVYGMGDFWEHSIIVEKLTALLSDVRYPQFLDGERCCSPEDCGGAAG
jgi:Plasmid pRiA4b ORF-3-like protein